MLPHRPHSHSFHHSLHTRTSMHKHDERKAAQRRTNSAVSLTFCRPGQVSDMIAHANPGEKHQAELVGMVHGFLQ